MAWLRRRSGQEAFSGAATAIPQGVSRATAALHRLRAAIRVEASRAIAALGVIGMERAKGWASPIPCGLGLRAVAY